MADKSGDIYEDLLKSRDIYIDGDIDNSMANRTGKMILWLNSQKNSEEEIILHINCGGGSVLAGLDLYDIVKFSKAPITGIVFREANSMAPVVLQACSKRKAMEHSTFSFHHLKYSMNKEWDELVEAAKKAAEELKEDQEKVFKILASRGGDLSKIKELCQQKKTISAHEAKEYGLIDEVI